MKRNYFLIIIILFFLFSLQPTRATVCEAGDSGITDIFDPFLGWIDSQPPNQQCIRGIYTNGTGGIETCTADPQCDGKDTNTYICNDGVGVAYCDFGCNYSTLSQFCREPCGADTICDFKMPGTLFADPSGDGTADYCGGGMLNYSCNYINQSICDTAFGADTLCDDQTSNTTSDVDSDGDIDLCSDTCSYFDCLNNNDSMCGGGQICSGTTCIQDPVCDIAYGSAVECDGVVRNQTIDADSDGDLDFCDTNCSYFDCQNNDSMCQANEICSGTTCITDPVCDVNFGSDPLCDGYINDGLYDVDSDGDLDFCDSGCSYFDCVSDNSSMCGTNQVCTGTTCIITTQEGLYLKIEYEAIENRISDHLIYGSKDGYVLGLGSQANESDTQSSSSYDLSLKTDIASDPIKLFLSSQEKITAIEEKNQYLEDYDFLNLLNPTFSDVSYDESRYLTGLQLRYPSLRINASTRLSQGYHRLIVEKKGIDPLGYPIISIRSD